MGALENSNAMAGNNVTNTSRLLRLLMVLLEGLLSVVAAHSQKSAIAILPSLTHVNQIREMTIGQAGRGYPVRIRGVVTYYSWDTGDLFIQDSTAGIWVDPGQTKLALHQGEFVEVEGLSGVGELAPVIEPLHFRGLGEAPMPNPRRPTSEELASGRWDSQWIEMQGVVRSVAERDGRLVLNVSSGSFECSVFVLNYPSFPTDIVDSQVRIRGVFSGLYDPSSVRFIGFQVLTPSWADVKVLKRPPQPLWSVPTRPIRLFLRLTPEGAFTHRVRVRGVVTLQQLGRSLFIRDSEGALLVNTTQPTPLKVGDLIDAIGYPAIGDYTVIMRDAVFQRVGASPAPDPVVLSPEKLQAGRYNADLVRLSARLLNCTTRPGEVVLELQAGGVTFSAVLNTETNSSPLGPLRAGSLLQLIGVMIVEAHKNRETKGFEILLRSPADVVVLKLPSWWTARRISWLLVILAGFALWISIWVGVLRRRVEERTETIRATLESTVDGILVVNPAGKIVAYNRKFADLWRIPESVLESRDDNAALNFVLSQLKDSEAFLARVRQTYADHDAQTDDVIEFKDGRVFERHSEPQCVQGRNVGRVWGFRDITDRKRAEEAQRYLACIVESSDYAILGTAPDGTIVSWNAAAEALFGYGAGEILGKHVSTLVPVDRLDEVPRVLDGLSRGEIISNLETTPVRKDGTRLAVSLTISPIKSAAGEVIGAATIAHDISARKRAEELVRESEARFRLLFAGNPLPMFVYDLETLRILETNDATVTRYGYSREEFLKLRIADIRPAEDIPLLMQNLAQKRPPLEDSGPWRHKFKDGRIIDVQITSHLIEWSGQRAVLVVAQDITERKRAEEALRESEVRERAKVEELQALLDTVPVAVFVSHDPECKGITGNRAANELVRLPAGADHSNSAPENERPTYRPMQDGAEIPAKDLPMQRAAATGTPVFDSHYTLMFDDGIERHVSGNAAPLFDAEGKPCGAIGGFLDLTGRRREQEARRKAEEDYRKIFELALEGIYRISPDGKALAANPAMAKMLGFESPQEAMSSITDVGRQVWLDPSEYLAFSKRLEKHGVVRKCECQFLRKDGTPIWVSLNSQIVRGPDGQALYHEGFVEDITDRKQAEEALRESEERFRSLVENATVGIYRTTPDGRVLMANPRLVKMLGYSSFEELASRNLEEEGFGTNYSRRAFRDKIERQQEVRGLEAAWKRQDGSVVLIRESARVVRADDGSVLYYDGVVEDITQFKRAQEALQDSETRFRTLAEEGPLAIRISRDGLSIYTNQKYREMFGYPSAEVLVGRPLQEQWAPESRAIIEERILRRPRGLPVPMNVEGIAQRRDGSHFPVHADVTQVNLPDGPAILTFLSDISERKEAEKRIKESEEKFRKAFMTGADGFFIGVTDGAKFVEVNDCFVNIFGYTREEVIGKTPSELGLYDGPAVRQRLISEYVSKGKVRNLELKGRKKSGEPITALLSISMLQGTDGRLALGAVRDITEQKRAEEKLKESEEKFRKAFVTAADGMYIATLKEGRIIEINDRYEDVFGYTRSEVIGKTSLELGLYRNAADRQKLIAGITSQGYVRNLEMEGRKKDGELVTILLSANMLEESKEPFLLGVVRDVTVQKRAEESLVRLRQAVDASGEVVFITDPEGIFTFVNPEFTRLYGYAEGEVLSKVTPRILKSGAQSPKKDSEFWKSLSAKRVVRGQVVNKAKDGRLLTINSSVSPILDEGGNITGFLAIQRDITERKRLEEQFIQAQKMEAVGRLAAGVAHDFNNLLTIINGHSGLMLRQLPADDRARESFGEIKDAGERAAGLTRQLLAFSRQQVRTSSVLNLNTLVGDSLKMLRRLIGEDIELVFNPVSDLSMVFADTGQIEQVLMNLVVNSRDAMPSGGTLSIEISNYQADRTYAAGHYPMNPGTYVMLAVSDTGNGMDAETQSRIFEPFFTTKGPGKGTGLGLATVYGIVKQNNGYIWVYSELGHGTTFKIFLPAVEGAPEPAEVRGAKSGGSETVLLVEDEVKLRSLARRVLETEGYKVLEAPGGMEALLIASQYKDSIHIMVTDVVMPLMSGRELAERLAKARSQIKILYMSGYTDDTIVRHGILESGVAFLQKPFAPELLARKVREVLDA